MHSPAQVQEFVPLNRDEVAALRRISSPTVSNAVETFNVRPRGEAKGGEAFGFSACFRSLAPWSATRAPRRFDPQSLLRHDDRWFEPNIGSTRKDPMALASLWFRTSANSPA